MASDIPLVARHRELAVVTEAIESAADGRGQGVLITGEAGIGKTRLLREAREAAEQRGLPVLTGRAVESGGAYRPLVEAFARPAAGFATHPDLVGVRPALARVLPGWVAETAILAPMADPATVLAAALILLLETMAPNGRRPLVRRSSARRRSGRARFRGRLAGRAGHRFGPSV